MASFVELMKDVDISEDGCWIMPGPKVGGYVRMRVDGIEKLAHVAVYESVYGDVGDKLVMHRCDNRACGRIDHLESGTTKNNNDDRVAKGRSVKPKGNVSNSKISFAQAEEIRNRHGIGESIRKLAKVYGISTTSVCRIINGTLHTTGVNFTGIRSDFDRLMDKVDIEGDGCWEVKTKYDRYGRIMIGRKVYPAHHASYEMFYGVKLGVDDRVLHECDNRPCIRPDHLRKGTLSDNAIDTAQKGRHPRQKLNPQKVMEIRAMIKEGKDINEIAKGFGVKRGAVCDIKYGNTWSHVAQ